jgi:predicted histidine transporter YuiF (NhaC family)
VGIKFIDIIIITGIEILFAIVLAAILKVMFFRRTYSAFRHILKFGLAGIFIAIIFGQIVESTFTEDKYLLNAGRLLVVQLPTYLMFAGLIIGIITQYRKKKKEGTPGSL